jgi:hypothetical protein
MNGSGTDKAVNVPEKKEVKVYDPPFTDVGATNTECGPSATTAQFTLAAPLDVDEHSSEPSGSQISIRTLLQPEGVAVTLSEPPEATATTKSSTSPARTADENPSL